MNLTSEINKIIDHLNKKEFKTVINSCENLIKLNIENTIVYNLYGQAYQNLKLYKKSITKFEKSIELQENNFFAINNLAVSLKAIEKYKLSEEAYKKCLKIKPDYIIAIINYANLKEFLNEFDEAINLNLSALRLQSNTNEFYIYPKLCRLHLAKGNIREARNYSLKLLEKYPKETSFYELHSEIVDLEIDKSYLSNMETLHNKKQLSNEEIINLSFPLGKAYDKLKNYEKAFKYFDRGNMLKRKQINYNIEDFLRLTNSIKKIFKNLDFQKIKKKYIEKKIIFICGMPRSGTTLIEQIISSHRHVLPTGENNYMSTFIKKNYLNNFSLDEKKINQHIFSDDNLFQDYVFNLFDELNHISKVFTDKSVQNFLWIGFIKIFFPNSKIIITERNSKDICLSIFKINFKNGFMNFAYNEKDIANFYNVYLDLIEFWKEIFDEEIFIIKYENLIDDPESQIKKMINYCNLEWDSNCLKHHQNRSAIKTASISQARKPIYKSSKNLNQNYSKYLGKMFSLLKN